VELGDVRREIELAVDDFAGNPRDRTAELSRLSVER
jgi:hypothetical protein